MDLKLSGKSVFISGSTSGIGFATANQFLVEGASVILNGRSQSKIDEAIEKLLLINSNGDVSGIACDFSDKNSVEALTTQLGDVDILINNVGIYSSQSFYETSDEDWYRMFEVNVMSGVRLSRSLLPNMIKKNWGRVIFVSSECAMLVPEDLIAYSMTKAAMLSISRGLAQTTKGTEVTVNAVLPGSTLSEGAQDFLNNQAEQNQVSKEEVARRFFSDVRTTSILGRFASTDEIASSIVYLSSPLASATNGAAIKLDGGSIPGII